MRTKSIMLLILVLSLAFSVWASAAQNPPKVGDYLVFGKYYGAPVLWRVVELDEKGNPMLLSDRVIAIKPFDARGSMGVDSLWPADVLQQREKFGSNYWTVANMRQWLNSYAETIQWVKSAPSLENVLMSNNPYDREKGFLADGNFTKDERSLILVVDHKALLSSADMGFMQGGTQLIINSDQIGEAVRNYEDAYYQIVKDGVFLPDIKEIHDVYLSENVLGADFLRAKPTKEAVDNSTYKDSGLSPDQYWSYRLRTPAAGNGETVCFVTADGKIDYQSGSGYDGTIGIRPAVWLNYANVHVTGSGSRDDPFVVKGSQKKNEESNKVLLTSFGGILVVFLMIFSQRKSRRKRKKAGRLF